MAFDAYQVEHIREILQSKKVIFEEKKMMGGLCIMVDDKMLCGVLQDKETGGEILMARVGTEFYHEALKKKEQIRWILQVDHSRGTFCGCYRI